VQGVHNQTKTHLLSWSHLVIDNHNSSAKRSCPECCSPGRDELTMSMSSQSQPRDLRWATNPSCRSARPESKCRTRKGLPLLCCLLMWVVGGSDGPVVLRCFVVCSTEPCCLLMCVVGGSDGPVVFCGNSGGSVGPVALGTCWVV
jgi:hypothetical protein